MKPFTLITTSLLAATAAVADGSEVAKRFPSLSPGNCHLTLTGYKLHAKCAMVKERSGGQIVPSVIDLDKCFASKHGDMFSKVNGGFSKEVSITPCPASSSSQPLLFSCDMIERVFTFIN